MKTLVRSRQELEAVGRWDIDFHLPPEGIKKFPASFLKRIDEVADVVKDKRDPSRTADEAFRYVDISSVEVATGSISSPQDLEGSEAPSRARKVIRAFDVLVSTCRPTRGAVAVVPVALHDQIASTAFSVVRAREGLNPFYLHYALRLPSTLEQFRKWSTGSSYPAILDSDVLKTVIPVPDEDVQDQIATQVVSALKDRARAIRQADYAWNGALAQITSILTGQPEAAEETAEDDTLGFSVCTLEEVKSALGDLPPIRTDNGIVLEDGQLDLAGL